MKIISNDLFRKLDKIRHEEIKKEFEDYHEFGGNSESIEDWMMFCLAFKKIMKE